MSAASAVQPRVQERPQWYVGKVTNAALVTGLRAYAQNVPTDTDAPFRLFGIGIYVFDNTGAPLGAAGNIGIRLRVYRPDGSDSIEKNVTTGQAVNPYDAAATNGAGGLTAPYYSMVTPVNPNIVYPSGSVITFDLELLTGIADAQVIVVFVGTKLFAPGGAWGGPQYPANYQSRPFFGYPIQISTANLPSLNNQLLIGRDADFVLQTAVQTTYPAAALTPVGGLRGLGIRMKDWNGKYYSNDYVPVELIFGPFDNCAAPGIIYPEIYIPKNNALYFDLAMLGLLAIVGSPLLTVIFGGLKVYGS